MSDKDKATLEHDDKQAAQENVATIPQLFRDLEYVCATALPDAAVVLSPDVDALAYLLAGIRKALKQLKDADQFVEDEMTKIMPGRNREVAGLGMIEMHTGSKRNEWDHDAVVDAAVPRVYVNVLGEGKLTVVDEDGTEMDGLDLTRRIVDEWRKLGNTSWRTGGGNKPGLRTFGLDPDEFCHVTYGRKTIQLPPDPTLEDGSE